VQTLRTLHRRRQLSCVLIAIWLVFASQALSTESMPPSTRPGDVDELQQLPADSLVSIVLDLTWLVEDLRADQQRQAVVHQVTADTLARRVEWMRHALAAEKDSRPSMFETYAIPLGMAAGILVGAWAATR